MEDNWESLNTVLHFVSASDENQNEHTHTHEKESSSLTIAFSELLEAFNSFSQLTQTRLTPKL